MSCRVGVAGLLASGGGTADRCIRFWNTLTGDVQWERPRYEVTPANYDSHYTFDVEIVKRFSRASDC